ncbi:MAG: hypothetical protein WA154_12930 [Moraxellaceae bacterium]
MSEVSRYIAGAYQGVSQVAPQDRLEGACEEMVNCLPSIPNAITKRPPLEYLTQVMAALGTPDAYFGEIPRGDPLQDATLVMNNEGGTVVPRLFNSASQAPIAFTSISSQAQAYLDANNPSPQKDLRVFSIEDVTFIVNRTVKVAKVATVSAGRPHEAIIWARTGAYARNTQVTVVPTGGTTVSAGYRPAAGGSAADAGGVGTDRIAEGLTSGAIPPGSSATVSGTPLNTLASQGFFVIHLGSIIYISHPTTPFNVYVEDDQGGAGVVSLKDSVQRFSDLPRIAVDGFVIRVAQESAGGNSDYYVRFRATSTTEGVWEETIAPSTPLGLDPLTMPVAITRNDTTNEWKVEVMPWTGRTTGTEVLSPDPDFVGDYIRDLSWLRGRLALVARNSTYLSASDNPYKFYTTTLAAPLDSDPIGFLPPADRKVYFEEAVAFDERMVVMGDKGQGIITAGDVLKAGSSKMTLLGTASFNPQVPTQKAFNKVYFAAISSNNTNIFELAVDRISGLVVPNPMTPAVPTYLPKTISRAATYDVDYMTVYGSAGQPEMYLHGYRHAESERVQNAWSQWTLPSGYGLCGHYVTGSTMHFLIIELVSGALHWCRMELSPKTKDPGGSLLTHQDFRVSNTQVSRSYDSSSDTTVVTFPFTLRAPAMGSVRQVQDITLVDYAEGYAPEVLSQGPDSITLQGDWSTAPMYFGYKYASWFVPTTWYHLGRDEKPMLAGRTTIRRLLVDLALASYIRFEVMVLNKGWTSPKETAYEGYQFDQVASPIDAPPPKAPANTRVVLPVNGNNLGTSVRFINDSHLGFALVGYEWVGDFNARARRMT